MEKACKQCRRIIEGNICPICKESQLTPSWKGLLIVIDPDNSEIAKRFGITIPGKYALNLGK
jgi:DNA-directed RNA polymerase subunit E"